MVVQPMLGIGSIGKITMDTKAQYTTPTKNLDSVVCAEDGSTITFKLSKQGSLLRTMRQHTVHSLQFPADEEHKAELRPAPSFNWSIQD
jgi:hypothetical protein